MRLRHRLLSSFALLLALAVWTDVPAQALSDTQSLRVLFTSCVQGKLHDCGCKTKPLGGLARRAALLDELSQSPTATLRLDGGNLLPPVSASRNSHAAEFSELSASLGYELVGVGAQEIAHGMPETPGPTRGSGLRFVSANLVGPAVERFAVVRRDGVRIAYTSVVSPSSAAAARPEVQAADPLGTLNDLIPEMRAAADLVIVAFAMELEATESVLRQLGDPSGCDLAIVAEGRTHLARARHVGSTTVVAANAQGKYLGQVDLTRSADGAWDAQATLHPLSLDLPEDPAVAARIRELDALQELTPSQAGAR